MSKNTLFPSYIFDYEQTVLLPVAQFESDEVTKLYQGASRYATYLLSRLIWRQYDDAMRDPAITAPEHTPAARLYRDRNLLLAMEQRLIGEDLNSVLAVDQDTVTLGAGRFAARWRRKPKRDRYEIDAVGGYYPAGPHGWEAGKFVEISEGHYDELPRTPELIQNPALAMALEFDRLRQILSECQERDMTPMLYTAHPLDSIEPKPPVVEI